VLGAFPEGCDDDFIDALEKMCNVMHLAAFGCICGEIVVSISGDVLDLKATLKRAIVFDRVLRESTGKEKQKLFAYLQEI